MKKLAVLMIVLSFSVMTFGQSKWNGFFKPVTYDTPRFREMREYSRGEFDMSIWLFRPTVSLTALQFTWDKEAKAFQSTPFSSVGMGIGYQHYIDVDNEPYNNFGLNALVLMNQSTTDDPVTASLVVTVTALRFISVGTGYDLGRKVVFLLTGVSYSF